MELEWAPSPVVDRYGHRVVKVQIQEGCIVGLGQWLVAVQTKSFGCRFNGWTFGNGERAVVARAHEIEYGAHCIHMGCGQRYVRDDKVGLDQDALLRG